MSKWKCKKCGACCRHEAVKMFLPHFWDEDKKQCKHLTEDNLCAIYPTRPDICMVPEGVDRTEECRILRNMEE